MCNDQDRDPSSLFSSPAIGSFASPRFHAKGPKSKGFALSDDDTDDDEPEDYCGVDERNEDATFFGGSWKRKSNSFSLSDSRQDSDQHSSNNVGDGEDIADLDLLSSSDQPRHVQQQLLLRFSCADSLDRTNLASFFVALQFVGKMHSFPPQFCYKLKHIPSYHATGEAMRELGVPFAAPPPATQYSNQKRPSADTGKWALLQAPLDACLRCIGPSICDALVQSFLLTGNDRLQFHDACFEYLSLLASIRHALCSYHKQRRVCHHIRRQHSLPALH
jgi:hypothetical protein